MKFFNQHLYIVLELDKRHRNNFDFLRLLLSSFVIISHSYAFLGMSEQEPLSKLTKTIEFSSVGVGGFFALSGFLIYRSVLNSSSTIQFLKKRFLRIFPGLITVILLCTFGLGPLATILSVKAYLVQPDTYAYLLKNILLLPNDNRLPGVFQANNISAVNGSLWTLRYEVLCYGFMLLFYLIPLSKHKSITITVYLLLLAGNTVMTYYFIVAPRGLTYHLANFFRLTCYFYGGVLMQQYRQYWFPYVNIVAVSSLLLVACLGLLSPHTLRHLVALVYPIVMISVGCTYLPQLQIGKQIGDISYGTYIYAFPIQQLLVMSGVTNLTFLLLVSLILSWAAGWLSFHLIEKRFIHRRRNTTAALRH